MRARQPAVNPSEFLYDGGLAGFYSCVFEAFYQKCLPADIRSQEHEQLSLFVPRHIPTQPEHARRVRASIQARLSSRTLDLVETVFFSCLPQKELALLKFLFLAYREGSGTVYRLGHPLVAPLIKAEGHLLRERHLLFGFIRFCDHGGALHAVIRPKNFVLPFLAEHFITRFSQEDFLIYDAAHHAALVYQGRKARIIPMEEPVFPESGEEERRYQALWKQFYQTIAIESRANPKLRMSLLPKRYWENMTEMRDL